MTHWSRRCLSSTCLALAPLVLAGCYGLSRQRPGEDAEPDGTLSDAGIDGDARPDTSVDAAAPCPPPVTGSSGVTSPMITTDPSSYVEREVVVVGTLTTTPWSDCDDLGPCGTCQTGLAIDGVIALRGPGGGETLCEERMACEEEVDSCLPRWRCWPFGVGQRVRAQGMWRGGPDTAPAMDQWEAVLRGYFLEVEAIEAIESVGGEGLFAGTLRVGGIEGDCPAFPSSMPVELVVAYAHPGMVVELMDPSADSPGEHPVLSGWHTGRLPHDPAPFELTSRMMGLGVLTVLPAAGGFEATYRLGFSGRDCTVESTITAEQVL